MAAVLLHFSILASWIASATEHARQLPLTSTSFPGRLSELPAANGPLVPASHILEGGGLSRKQGCTAVSRDSKRVEQAASSPGIAETAYKQSANYPDDSTSGLALRRRRPTPSRHTAALTRVLRFTKSSPSTTITPNSDFGPVVEKPGSMPSPTPSLPLEVPAAGATDTTSQTPSLTSNPTLSPLPLLDNPLKVFILAGQSNAAGQGSISHLDNIIRQNCEGGCNKFRNALWNETSNSYKVNHEVFEKYLTFNSGPLSVHDNLIAASSNDTEYQTFGPDLMLGWVVNEALGEPIAIIKTAWGGKSLAVEFRPPSAGTGNYSGVDPSLYGLYYNKMVNEIALSLNEIHSWAPSYNDEQGYVLSGFVWFQGYNDLVNQEMCDEYGSNLASLIRDLRTSLDQPELPVVVGELGMHGTDERYMPDFAMSRIVKIRSSQFLVTKLSEFLGNTLFVSTSQYAVLDGDQYSGVYHYCGRADTFFYIGAAFGRGLLSLLGYGNVTESNECRCDAVDSLTHT